MNICNKAPIAGIEYARIATNSVAYHSTHDGQAPRRSLSPWPAIWAAILHSGGLRGRTLRGQLPIAIDRRDASY